MSVSSALIRSIYPLSHLGRGLSLNTVIAASAAAFAPTVGGAILAIAPWPWLFAAVVPFGILSIVIGHKALPDSIRHHQPRSEEHTSELQSLMRISYAVFCLKKKKEKKHNSINHT